MLDREPAHSILIVDDNREDLRLLSEALRSRGFKALTATRGAHALEVLESRSGAGVRLIITELTLPDLDGMELAVHIGILRGNLKILIISGYADAVVVHSGFDGHNVEFISKPFDINELCEKIKVILA